jgi:hypothetical protein
VIELADLRRQRSHVDPDDNPLLAADFDRQIALLEHAERLRALAERGRG